MSEPEEEHEPVFCRKSLSNIAVEDYFRWSSEQGCRKAKENV